MSCRRNRQFVASSSVAIVSGNMQITIPNQTIFNGECIDLIIIQPLPTSATPIPVVIIVNGATIPLYNKCGNKVYSDQIRTRKRYLIKMATDVPLAIKVGGCDLCCTSHVFPTLTAPTSSAINDIDTQSIIDIFAKKGENDNA